MRSIVALSMAAVLSTASVATAQEQQQQQQGQQQAAAPAQPEAPAEPQISFNSDAGMIFNLIHTAQATEFESVLAKIKEALAKSEDPIRRQQAQAWKVFKSADMSQDPSQTMYIFWFDPAVKGAEYDPVRILSEAFPTEVNALYEKLKAAYIRLNKIDLQMVATMGGMTPAMNHQQ